VTNTKRINRNLLRKETRFVCYTSSEKKLRTAAKIKTQDYKFDPNYNPSTKHSYKTV